MFPSLRDLHHNKNINLNNFRNASEIKEQSRQSQQFRTEIPNDLHKFRRKLFFNHEIHFERPYFSKLISPVRCTQL